LFPPQKWHWSDLDVEVPRPGRVKRITWAKLCENIKTLPPRQLWRHNSAGDLPGIGDVIDPALLDMLVRANKGKCGWTYTHKPVGLSGQPLVNAQAIYAANKQGFVVNLSTESLRRADELVELKIAPVVVAVPSDTPKVIRTPAGRKAIVCPHETTDGDVQCDRCRLCLKRDRSFLILFRAHAVKWAVPRIDKHLRVLQAQELIGEKSK
jgi:hypothetical protein